LTPRKQETELAGGLLVGYSGRNLALFYLSSAVKTLVMGAIIVALFLPWNISSYIAMPATLAALADLAFFLLKVILVMTIVVTLVRVGMARLRINQVVTVYWIYLSAIGLAGILLLMADAALAPPGVDLMNFLRVPELLRRFSGNRQPTVSAKHFPIVTMFFRKVSAGEVSMVPAVSTPPMFRGKIEYQRDGCIGCKLCTKICPSNAIEFLEDTKRIRSG
jgi:hypothetical protein